MIKTTRGRSQEKFENSKGIIWNHQSKNKIYKGTNNDLQNTTTKYWATQTLTKTDVISNPSEWLSVPALLVTPVIKQHKYHLIWNSCRTPINVNKTDSIKSWTLDKTNEIKNEFIRRNRSVLENVITYKLRKLTTPTHQYIQNKMEAN